MAAITDYTTTITINNVAPELINIVVDDASINEGETATITMTIDDPGALDVFEVDVNWQDGGGVDTIGGLGAMDVSGTVGGHGVRMGRPDSPTHGQPSLPRRQSHRHGERPLSSGTRGPR